MTSKYHSNGYRSNNNVYFLCHYHVVWTPKYRKSVLVGEVRRRLQQIIQDVCQDHEVIIEALAIKPDHVHALLNIDPQFGINRVVKLIKGRTSELLREEFPHLQAMPHLWTNSYFVATYGGTLVETVQQYIERQQ